MLLEKFIKFGVVSRDDVRNDASSLRDLLRKNFVQKVYKKGRVFYELTDKSLSLLEAYRQVLFYKAKLMMQLQPHAKLYKALLGELRFLDEKNSQAYDYQFLGDWQLARPIVLSQLELSKLRYYEQKKI